jgi:hypothetical protein
VTTRFARKERQISRRQGALKRLPSKHNAQKLAALGGHETDAGAKYIERRTASLAHERTVLEKRIAGH